MPAVPPVKDRSLTVLWTSEVSWQLVGRGYTSMAGGSRCPTSRGSGSPRPRSSLPPASLPAAPERLTRRPHRSCRPNSRRSHAHSAASRHRPGWPAPTATPAAADPRSHHPYRQTPHGEGDRIYLSTDRLMTAPQLRIHQPVSIGFRCSPLRHWDPTIASGLRYCLSFQYRIHIHHFCEVALYNLEC
jgi:hypothetical protein